MLHLAHDDSQTDRPCEETDTMSAKTFDEFVKRRLDQAKANESSKDTDWQKKRDDWIRSLEDLYSTMEHFLKKYTEAGQIQIIRDKVQLSEDYLGSYEVERLTFRIGNDKIIAKPIGRLMIGAAGRVDLIGARGTLRLVLLEKGKPEPRIKIEIGGRAEERYSQFLVPRNNVKQKGWYIATLPPQVTVTELSSDAFQDALVELSDV